MRKLFPAFFALALALFLVLPSVSASAYSPPNSSLSVVADWVITWVQDGLYNSTSLPVYTEDTNLGSFPILDNNGDISAYCEVYYDNTAFTVYYDFTWFVDIEYISMYTNSAQYVSYVPSPDPFPLACFSSDAAGSVSVSWNVANLSYSVDTYSVSWDFAPYSNDSTIAQNQVFSFDPSVTEHSIITSSLIEFTSDSSIQSFSFGVYLVPDDYFSPLGDLGDFLDGWVVDTPTPQPPVVDINPVEWLSDIAEGILSLEIFPGFTIGGIVFAFLFVAVAVILLKMYAGG